LLISIKREMKKIKGMLLKESLLNEDILKLVKVIKPKGYLNISTDKKEKSIEITKIKLIAFPQAKLPHILHQILP